MKDGNTLHSVNPKRYSDVILRILNDIEKITENPFKEPQLGKNLETISEIAEHLKVPIELNVEKLDKLEKARLQKIIEVLVDSDINTDLRKAMLTQLLGPGEERKTDELFPSNNGENIRTIAVPSSSGFQFIDMYKIIRCESDNSYTTFILEGEKPRIISRSIKEIESQLPEDMFMRVHQSHIINIRKILEFHKKGQCYLVMTDNYVVPVSKRKRCDFIEKLARIIPGIIS